VVASSIFATVAAGSLSATARTLGVAATIVQRWADPEHDAALTLGDLLVLPPSLAEGVLLAALAHVRARKLGAAMPAPERVLRVAGSASDLVTECVRAARDGRIDAAERARLRGVIRELERELAPTYSALAGETD
jgi:hypothetical protein